MVNNLLYIKERVLYLADILNINKKKFVEDIKQTYGNFTGENRKRPLNSDTINNILSKYPEVNVEWLLTGNGTPLKKVMSNEVEHLAQEIAKQDNRIESLELKVDALNIFFLKNLAPKAPN